MKKNKNKHYCKWCGEKSNHTSDKHVYEDEVKLKKNLTLVKK